MGVISRILPPLASAYGLQTLFALVFVPQKNEMFYDFGGALGFLLTTFVSLYYPALREKYILGKNVPLPRLSSFASRQLLLSGCLVLWSVRLGTYLLSRALKSGGDSRFDEVKHQPAKFTFFWFAQGLDFFWKTNPLHLLKTAWRYIATWVFLVGLPVYTANTLPPSAHPILGARDYFSLGLFATSFLFEVIADQQKSAWRKEKNEKKHDEKFISRGLWGISRHPNYVGEVGIWTGIWLFSTSSLQTPYCPKSTPIMVGVSPVLTYLLVRKVSGVPVLEKAGVQKFAGDPRWEEYKRTVPIFWPWGPTN